MALETAAEILSLPPTYTSVCQRRKGKISEFSGFVLLCVLRLDGSHVAAGEPVLAYISGPGLVQARDITITTAGQGNAYCLPCLQTALSDLRPPRRRTL